MKRHAANCRPEAARCAVAAVLLASCPLILESRAEEHPKPSLVAPATVVADGLPWNMRVVDSEKEFQLTLMPNGTGIVEPSSPAPELTWWQSEDRVCLRQSMLERERCVILLVREGGYDAVENGALFFTLRR